MSNKLINKYNEIKNKIDNSPKLSLLVVATLFGVVCPMAAFVSYMYLGKDTKVPRTKNTQIVNYNDSIKQHMTIEPIQKQR